MRASSPVRQLAVFGAIALVGFSVLALRAGVVEAGPGARGALRWAVPPDSTDSTRTADSLRAVAALAAGDTTLADSLLAALRASAPAAAGTSEPPSGGALRSDSVVDFAALPALAIVRSDTDSVAVGRPGLDSLGVAGADTTVADTTRRAFEYLPGTPLGGTSVSIMPRRLPGVRGRLGAYWTREVTLDSAAYQYTVREEVGGADVRAPAQLTLDEYLVAQRRATLSDGFRSLVATRADRGRRRSGVGFTVDIPGGEQSAFRTLFGKNEVDLTVSGTSNVNLGLAYDQNDLQEARTGNSGIISPDFGQELNLNVAGTIGDKLRINVNYDTQSQFDFENQVSLVYTGYEDDIVQRIEAGNVFLQTPAELIQGGQRLFGLRTDLRFGPLALTAVASQQDAETSEVVIEGGSQATPFSIAPTEYENDTHFFLGFAFHNYWDRAHQQPGLRTLPPGFRELVGIEVWKHDQSLNTPQTTPGDDIIRATALADLAEPGTRTGDGLTVLNGGEEYLAQFGPDGEGTPLPDSTLDVYSEADLEEIRDNEDLNLETRFGLEDDESETGLFRRLRENVDYVVDGQLGWISLTTALSQNDFLAVSYQYRVDDPTDPNGRLVTVGDFSRSEGSGTDRRVVLKLLRADTPTERAPLWDLTMRNIYRIGGRSLNPNAFTLKLTYEAAGAAPREDFPDVTLGNQLTLLQVLGLDRVNQQGQATPDNAFDFQVGLTVDADNGRVIFPVRQPFGDYLTRLFREGRDVSGQPVSVTPTTGTAAEAAGRYAFEQLYELNPVVARREIPALSRYRIAGEFRSATQSVFNVGFNLVPGTVRVTAGGQDLTENADFRVNYNAGTVEIVNPLFLQNGQQIRVQVEQNRLFAIGSKTLLGLRADYRLAENTTFGATAMRLSERPLVDKFRVGEEALDNTILGFDGRYLAEPRWITRALDFLPLIQTRAPSRVEFRGEVARLSPGHPQTLAFDQTVRRLNDGGFDLPADELSGLSFVDDFEGSENAYGVLGETGGWRLAAPPDSSGPAGSINAPGGTDRPGDPRFRSNWRGLFAWYAITNSSYQDFNEAGLLTPATFPVAPRDLYPERYRGSQGTREATAPLGLLDLYFDPTRRGPYNYNEDLAGAVAANPRDVWGGMVRQIDGAYSDFEGQNNIEFIELLVAAVGGFDGNDDIQPGARMYIDLGRVNEDVVPNNVTSTEDGLRDGGTPTEGELDAFGRRAQGATNGVVDFFRETGRTEDIGLDGLPSRVGDIAEGGTPYQLDEQTYFRSFLDTPIPTANGEAARAALDPSNDDYHHFNDDTYFEDAGRFPARDGRPAGATVQERYAQWLPALELNSIQAQSEIVRSGQPGIATVPNTEDINGNQSVDFAEDFHRYEVPLDEGGLLASPFFQNTIVPTTGAAQGQTYYLLRIPVRTENRTSTPGLGDDFTGIEAVRVWTTGHDRPATIRVASFELVGSQWLQSDRVGTSEDLGGATPPGEAPRLFVATINNEESPDTYAIPRQAVYRETALTTPGSSGGGLTREQALVLRAETLADGRTAGTVRSYATRPLDLTKYSNVRLYVHGHGFERQDSLRVVVRLGDDETENYYEYEQPVYPFELADAARISDDGTRADSLWQTAVPVGGERVDRNSVNIVLSEFNKLKVSRDESGAPLDSVYRSEGAPEGAPAGARIAVRGQPSIQDIRTVVLGVRNGVGGSVTPLDTVEVWFNELRVTGYDEASGASGFLTANVVLADVATMNARFSATQDGFGDLGGGLGEREFADRTALSFTSSFNAHRLLPERFGWSIPVSYSMTANESTPRFDPNRGDIRLDELVDRALNDSTETAPPEADRQIAAAAIIERAQTVSGTRNFRVQLSKTGSRSPWLRYTVDGLTAAYTTTAQTSRDPSNALNDADSWAANVGYRVAVPRPKTVRPFWLLGGVPVARVLAGLRLNVLPQTVSFSTDARRSMSQVRSRLLTSFTDEPQEVRDFRVRTRRTQLFDHGRQLDMQYNPFPFLQLSYGSDTDQDLGAAGQNETNRILVRDSTGRFQTFDLSAEDARTPGSPVFEAFDVQSLAEYDSLTVLGGQQLDVLPVGEVLSGIFSGDRRVRTRSYAQSLTAALRVSTARVRWLSWIRPQALSYQASYQWTDVPIAARPDLVVAGAGSRVQLQTGLQLVPAEFWRLFPFYRRLEASAGRGPGAARGNRPGQAPAPPPRSGAAPAGGQTAAPDSAAGRRGFNPLVIPRNLFLAATGLTDVSVTYRGALTSNVGGLVGDSYSLLSGLRGVAPSLGYRLGLSRSVPLSRRLTDASVNLQYADLLSDQHTLEARTTVEPFRALRVGLTWQTSFQEADRLPFSYVADPASPTGSSIVPLASDRRGTGQSTVYSFGGSYDALLERHRQRFLDDTAGEPGDGGRYTSEYLLRTGLAADFQTEFARGIGAFGPRGLFPIPVPGWDITYSGLNSWPLLRRITQQVTLRHNYSATSQADYSSFFEPGVPRPVTVGNGAGATTFNLAAPAIEGSGSSEANVVTVNERFQPLIGAAIGIRGGIQADVTWNRSNLYTLQTTSNSLTEKTIEDVQVQLSYAKTGLRLLGLRRLNNNLRLTLTASLATDETAIRNIRTDLDNLLRGLDPVDRQAVSTRRIQLWPRISYTVSNQVTADVFLRYERSKPSGTNAFPTRSFDGGVSLRILFSN